MRTPRKLLMVAGSDSFGGAGLQADINVARSFGAYPLSCVSCVTSQSPLGFSMLEEVSPRMFRSQLECSLIGGLPDAVKIGMVCSERQLEILAGFLDSRPLRNVVADPVMAPSLGSDNFRHSAWHERTLIGEMAPHIDLLTPNIPETIALLNTLVPGENLNESLTGDNAFSRESGIVEAGDAILQAIPLKGLLIKGGHSARNADGSISDFLITAGVNSGTLTPGGNYVKEFRNTFVDTINTHGTGCNLSSAIACYLADGYTVEEAVGLAEQYLNRLLSVNSGVDFLTAPLPDPDDRYAGPVAIFNGNFAHTVEWR